MAGIAVVSAGAAILVVANGRAPSTAAHDHAHAAASGTAHADHHRTSGTTGASSDGLPPVRSVLELTGPQQEPPDVRYELTARTATIQTDSGRVISALTYDGTSPGPELHARVGQLVEVVLNNADVSGGVTIHWHGIDVPNAEDGVAGVTQDAVFPGQRHVYRFRPDRVGTFWYHSHQDSARSVARGLYGAVIIEPAQPDPVAGQLADLPLIAHTWTDPLVKTSQEITIGMSARLTRRAVHEGEAVRLRLINTDNLPQNWAVTGASFRVTGIDGAPVNAPTDLRDTELRLAGGGRYDIELTMPSTVVSVRLRQANQPAVLLVPGVHPDLSTAADADPPSVDGTPRFDPLGYGSPSPAGNFDVNASFDREYEQVLDTARGSRGGIPYMYWTVNGQTYPNIPEITVRQGDLVRLRIVNRGSDVHPMHLHGHHVLVLSRNGVIASGSPWWTDTLGVEPGDDFVVAFRADNPGVWMDHCHNLSHAAAGMVMHLSYEGVTSPFSMDHGNLPE